jgi:hypothetical protein
MFRSLSTVIIQELLSELEDDVEKMPHGTSHPPAESDADTILWAS